MGADKNSSPKRELGLCPKFITKGSQGHIVTTDLPTLGRNPKQSRSERTIHDAKDLADRPRAAADCRKNDPQPLVRHP
jgi:hypothetical protein